MLFEGFETERVRLRAFTVSDLSAFTSYRNDPDVARYQSWENYKLEQAHNLFEQSCKDFNVPDSWYQIAIADLKTDELIGDCAVNFKPDNGDGDSQVEIGFTMAKLHQGRGYAREAVGALVKYLFTNMKKRRITSTVDVLNDRSIHLLEALHFRKEGHFVENLWLKGRWGSEYSYALLAKEVANL